MNSNRLAGHELPHEGRLYRGYWEPPSNGPGRAQCSCGERSPKLPSTNARKRWHREHKDAIRAATAAGGAEGDKSKGSSDVRMPGEGR